MVANVTPLNNMLVPNTYTHTHGKDIIEMHKNEHIKALKMNYKNLIFGNCVHERCIGMEYFCINIK